MKILVGLLNLLAMLTIAEPARSTSADKVIVDRIMADFNLHKSQYEIDVLSNPLRDIEFKPDQMKLRPLTLKEPLGLFTVLAEIGNDDSQIKHVQVRLRVRKFADVLVAGDRLKRNQPIDKEKLISKRMDVTSLREQPVRLIDRLDGYRLRRNLSKGKILTTGAIEPVPDIEVGREVSIVFASDQYTITAPGRALQTGWAGKQVKVKNTASGKIITARVIDSSSVAVDR